MDIHRREFLKSSAAATVGLALPLWGRAQLVAPDAIRYPDDAFSRPTHDRLPTFETLDGLGVQFAVRTRAQHFAGNELRLVREGDAQRTCWRLHPRDVTATALIVDERIRREPTSVSFRIRNASASPMTVTLHAHELSWEAVSTNTALPWLIGSAQTVAPGEDRVLDFPFAQVTCPEPATRARPRYPINALVITVQGLEPGQPHELTLGELTVHYPPAPGLAAAALEIPETLVAGRLVVWALELRGDPGGRVIDLEVRRGAWVIWRTRFSRSEVRALAAGRARVQRRVPWYVASGDVTVGLVADGYRVDGAEGVARVTNDTRPRLPRAERTEQNGRPTFLLDGRPFPMQGYSSYDYQPGSVAEFGAHGTNVFCIPCCAGRHVHHVAAQQTWVEPERFDFGQIDERVGFSLEANPEGVLFLRVSLALPHWWTQDHESELACIATDGGRLVWEEGAATPVASLASETWRTRQTAALRELLRYCRAQPWASRLAGVWVTCEVTEEWFAWACNDGLYSDYSDPNEAEFARRTGSAVPMPEARKAPGYDTYPDTPEGHRAALYHQYQSDLTAEAIAHFARVVKEETAGRLLVGVFYGYVIQLAGEPRQALSGHFALRQVLDDPDVDFIGGIPLHDFRLLINGYSAYVSATESIRVAGKLYCNENDLFSWLHPLIWHVEYDPQDPRGAAISMHRRECANDAVHGALSQKFSLMTTWHHDAALQADFARQSKVIGEALRLDRTPVDEIAFVVDDSTFAWMPPESTLAVFTHKRLLYHLGLTGAPVGVWLLSDLGRLPERVRFVVLAGATAAQPHDLAKLKQALERGERTLLVVGTPGLVNRETGGWRPDAVADLLGLPIGVQDARLPAAVALAGGGAAVPSAESVRPRAYVEGDGFLRYEDGSTAGTERPLPAGGRLIWCGVPPLSSPILREWAVQAGVHCYAPTGCFVHAAGELVSVTSPLAGQVRLRWREPVQLADLFDGWQGEGSEVDCPFAAGQTRLLALRRS